MNYIYNSICYYFANYQSTFNDDKSCSLLMNKKILIKLFSYFFVEQNNNID